MIKATIVQDSVSLTGSRITTFELDYPRFIHAELMTHRVFSRNAASSRAVPIEKMIEHVKTTPAMPVYWGKNKAGMQAVEELNGVELQAAQSLWERAATNAAGYSKQMSDAFLHKQLANRVTEPFQTMKTIVTATEYDNWYTLRMHSDAQPEIHKLAKCMFQAVLISKPKTIHASEWHVPYVDRHIRSGKVAYYNLGSEIDVETAKIVSASCCAQVSYRKNDDSLEKAHSIYDRLINTKPMHASPIEHQATPMRYSRNTIGREWESGVTHLDNKNYFWSGNFKGWIQNRQLI